MTSNESGATESPSRAWALRFGVAVVASLVLALIGPFTTYSVFSFLERLLYWGGLTLGLIVPAYLIRSGVKRFLTGPPLQTDIIAAACIAVVLGAVVWLFNSFVMGFDVPFPGALAEHVLAVFLVCSVPVAIRAYLRARLTDASSSEQQGGGHSGDLIIYGPFLRRLDEDKRGAVLRVSADGHQLWIHTDKGESRLRMRFSDALSELPEEHGTRIHRSHWVAYDFVEEIVPDGRRYMARLKCGANLPVSSNRIEALRKAGISVE